MGSLVTDVVLACNDNPKYYQYWNIVSEFYSVYLGIKPHLVFYGTAEQLEKCSLSSQWGDIKRIEPVSDPSWTYWVSTYLTLYGPTTLHDDAVCMVIGIDQVPLRPFWNGILTKVDDDTLYTMVTKNPYRYHWSVPKVGRMPGAYLIGKASTFKALLDSEGTFEDHIYKVFDVASRQYTELIYYDRNRPFPFWGLDECYLSICARKGRVNVCDMHLDDFIQKHTVFHVRGTQHFTNVSCSLDFNCSYEKIVYILRHFMDAREAASSGTLQKYVTSL